MEPDISISLRSNSGSARTMLQAISESGVRSVQIDYLHEDFSDMSVSAYRDLASTLRRLGLRASGVDFLVPATLWDEEPERTLLSLNSVVTMSTALGNVPIGTLIPEESELASSAKKITQQSGVLLSAHGSTPPEDPQVGWHLPISLLVKEGRPIKKLVSSKCAPMAIRLRGEIVGDSTLELGEYQVELRELRGVLDAMRWKPTPIIDCHIEESSAIVRAWQIAGPW
ncbi:MAG: hypothetical protein QF718_03275 [Phycisphaerales bacterium]|jgi:hypothetical protein|nr:hypothetical protein [Phycisphaerales bacterium]